VKIRFQRPVAQALFLKDSHLIPLFAGVMEQWIDGVMQKITNTPILHIIFWVYSQSYWRRTHFLQQQKF
jgi:hypothetical protein